MKSRKFYEPVYGLDVYAVWCSRDEFDKWLKRRFDAYTDPDNYTASTMPLPDNKGYVVWMEHNEDFYALIHESLHLVRMIFEARGINTDLKVEDENISYYQEYWFRTLWRWFGSLKKKKK